MSAKQREVLADGFEIDGYTVCGQLGSGGFGDVYLVKNGQGKAFALKTEFLDARKQALLVETRVLEDITNGNLGYFPRLVAHGETDRIRYMVLNVCGSSIAKVRSNHSNKITRKIVFYLAIEMLASIRAMHDKGYMHRDIKPSNFLLRRSKKCPVVLVDFGLSAPYIDFETGQLLPRIDGRFCGTRKYASTNAMNRIGLSRRDDLISWFYSILELFRERLPWATLRDNDRVLEMKEGISIDTLCGGSDWNMPRCLERIYRMLTAMDFEEVPNYEKLKQTLLDDLMSLYDDDGTHMSWPELYDRETPDRQLGYDDMTSSVGSLHDSSSHSENEQDEDADDDDDDDDEEDDDFAKAPVEVESDVKMESESVKREEIPAPPPAPQKHVSIVSQKAIDRKRARKKQDRENDPGCKCVVS